MKLSVLIPYSGDPWRDTLFHWLFERYLSLLPDAEMCIGTSEPFNRSKARNDAFRQSTGEILLIADADTVFNREQIQKGIELVEKNRTWVIPYGDRNYYNLSQEATTKILSLDPSSEIPEPVDSKEWEHKLESWAGLLIVPRVAFEMVGWYDERFIGWGYEDICIRIALDTLWGKFERTDDYCLHLWHPAPEDTRFEQPNIQDNRSLFVKYERAAGNPRAMRELIEHNR